MKPIDFIIAAALACTLLASGAASGLTSAAAPARAAGEAPGRTARYSAMEAELQERLRSKSAQKAFRAYNATHGQQIQQSLAVVYAGDADYRAEAAGPARLLSDSIVGPVTLKWLTRFCRDYGIVASDPDFEQEVVAALEHVAIIAKEHPDWMDILDSPEFDDWIMGQPAPQRERSRATRRSGAAFQVNVLIDQYKRERHPAPAPASAGSAEPVELTYSYDPKRMAGMQNVQQIVARLRTMADWPAEEEPDFDADLRDALRGLAVRDDTYALLKRLSLVDAYRLSPGTLKKMTQLNQIAVPEPALVELEAKLGGLDFADRSAFSQAFDDATGDSEFRVVLDKNKNEIVRGARQPRFKVPVTLAADLAADAKLEPAVAAVFAHFANIEYPTRVLFDKALSWQVQRALHMCPDPAPHTNVDGMLADAQFKALQPLLKDKLFASIAALRALHELCTANQAAEADMLAYEAGRILIPPLQLRMEFQVRHAMPRSAVRQEAWSTPGCSCGRNKRDGMVVGFYPLWTDGAGRQVNFGALTRLALYGLTADDAGGLRAPDGMDFTRLPDTVADLMREAHQYEVGVDWVVTRSDWHAWTRAPADAKRSAMAALQANIVKLLRQRPFAGPRQTLIRAASLGRDPGPADGDGIALYFRHFPAADRQLYNEFVAGLGKALNDLRPALRLSLIVDYDDLGERNGPFDYGNLVAVMDAVNHLDLGKYKTVAQQRQRMENDPVVLVMLPEPTRVTKKALRGAIQVALHGEDSMRLLRSIVPVQEYDGIGWTQLQDDIIYVADNYYGIGFWPLPFVDAKTGKAPGEGELNTRLMETFQPNGATEVAISGFRDRLCPYRLWLRWLFWLTTVLAVGVGIVYYSCRGCNKRVDDSVFYFVGMLVLFALPLLTLLILTFSDPLLDPYIPIVLLLYGCGGLVLAALMARYYFDKARRKVP